MKLYHKCTNQQLETSQGVRPLRLFFIVDEERRTSFRIDLDQLFENGLPFFDNNYTNKTDVDTMGWNCILEDESITLDLAKDVLPEEFL